MSGDHGADGQPPAARGDSAQRQAALARLAASRQRLQAAWVPAAAPRSPSGRGPSRRLGAWWRYWRRRAADAPVLGLALQSVESAWRQSPWRAAGAAVADELGHAARPWVRRHPVWTVALAAAAGGAVVALRPWTWPTLQRQVRLGPHRLGRLLIVQLRRAPVASILAAMVLAEAAAPTSRDGTSPPSSDTRQRPS